MVWGKRKLRPAVGVDDRYQILSPPAIAVRESSIPNAPLSRDRISPPGEGPTAIREPITQKGDLQEAIRRSVARLFGFEAAPATREWWLVAYVGSLVLLSSSVLLTLLLETQKHAGGAALGGVAALAVAALLAELQSVRLSPQAEVSVSTLPIVLAAVLYGPLAAICVSVASLLPTFRPPYARWLTWTTTRALAAAAAGITAYRIDPSHSHGFAQVVAAVTAATIAEHVTNLGLGCVLGTLRGLALRELASLSSPVFIAMPLYVPVTAMLVYSYRVVSPWSVALFLFPALVAQKLFLLYQEQRQTSRELAAAMASKERANLSFAAALVATLDARDRYTAGHSASVATYARDIAGRLGLPAEKQQLAHLAGLVHDIGKIGLPPGLLEKAGPLTVDERRQMEAHPEIGERILRNVEGYEEIADIVRYHHERFDGHGYPDGLLGNDIPLLARVLAVADAYDAMTSDRPYRDAMSSDVARLRLAQGVGTQFDTGVVAAFEAILATAPTEYPTGGAEPVSEFENDAERLSPLQNAPRLRVIAS
jgi:putative nucleotidyltransferase with HDIG domain